MWLSGQKEGTSQVMYIQYGSDSEHGGGNDAGRVQTRRSDQIPPP